MKWRKAAGFIPAYACYYVGDWASELCNVWPYRETGFWSVTGMALARFHQFAMRTSFRVDMWAGLGMWGPV